MDQILSFLLIHFIDSDIYTTLEEWTIQELEQQLIKLSLPGLTNLQQDCYQKDSLWKYCWSFNKCHLSMSLDQMELRLSFTNKHEKCRVPL